MDTYTLLIIIFVLSAFIFSIILFIKTPKNQRTQAYANKEMTEYLNKKLKSYPKEYEATLIIGNKKEAILSWLPYMLYFLPFAVFTLYVTKIVDNPFCTTIFEINVVVILIAIGFIALPLGVFGLSLSGVKMGIEAFKTGYYPPLNSIQLNDTIAVKTTFSKIKGILLILLPIIILLGALYVYISFMNMSDGNFFKFYEDKINKKCLQYNKTQEPIFYPKAGKILLSSTVI